jgi:hypothetical protein
MNILKDTEALYIKLGLLLKEAANITGETIINDTIDQRLKEYNIKAL